MLLNVFRSPSNVLGIISFPKMFRRCTAGDEVHCAVLLDATAQEASENLNL
jgi:hypothetical protein